jgi:DNA-binding transcriptional regulator GbsR (MarR family)
MADEELWGERQAFAQELGRFFEDRGLPRMEGRVLGWLVVCRPEHQSAEQLAEALGASRGAISMAMRLLQRSEAVERVTVPGSRRHYYRLRPGLWRQEIARRVEEAATVRALTAEGLERLAAAPDDDLARLRDMHEMYAFLEGGYTGLRDTWRDREARERPRTAPSPRPTPTYEGGQE